MPQPPVSRPSSQGSRPSSPGSRQSSLGSTLSLPQPSNRASRRWSRRCPCASPRSVSDVADSDRRRTAGTSGRLHSTRICPATLSTAAPRPPPHRRTAARPLPQPPATDPAGYEHAQRRCPRHLTRFHRARRCGRRCRCPNRPIAPVVAGVDVVPAPAPQACQVSPSATVGAQPGPAAGSTARGYAQPRSAPPRHGRRRTAAPPRGHCRGRQRPILLATSVPNVDARDT